jgi:hypothetical protein
LSTSSISDVGSLSSLIASGSSVIITESAT